MEQTDALIAAKARIFIRGERVVITGSTWKGQTGTFIKKNGSSWLIDLDNIAVRGICPLYVEHSDAPVPVKDCLPIESINAFALLQRIASKVTGILFFVDGDNCADLVPKHLVKFITTDHVLIYARHSLRLKLMDSYNKDPLRSIATLMPGPGSGKNAVDTILARDLGVMHMLCKPDVNFRVISRDRFDLSVVWREFEGRRKYTFIDTMEQLQIFSST